MIVERVQLMVAGAAVLALAAIAATQTWRLSQARDELQHLQVQVERERAQAAQAAADAQSRARAEEQRRAQALQEVERETETRNRSARVDAAAAGAAGDGLRVRADALAASCGGSTVDSSAAVGGATTADAGRVLANMLGDVTRAAVELAAIADERGAAGSACERAYESLTSKQGEHMSEHRYKVSDQAAPLAALRVDVDAFVNQAHPTMRALVRDAANTHNAAIDLMLGEGDFADDWERLEYAADGSLLPYDPGQFAPGVDGICIEMRSRQSPTTGLDAEMVRDRVLRIMTADPWHPVARQWMVLHTRCYPMMSQRDRPVWDDVMQAQAAAGAAIIKQTKEH